MQDRLTYANGNTITTEGFRCSVGEPIDIKVTVGENEEVDLQSEAGKIIPNGDHLITLEVNGEKAAYRDLYHLGDDMVTVGDYTISDDMYLDGVSEGDEVVMRLEPVELMVTDTFRAAVKSLGGSESSGGGSGGGNVEYVRFDIGKELPPIVICDHTKEELDAAREAGKELIGLFSYVIGGIKPRPEDVPAVVPAYIAAFYTVDFGSRTIIGNKFSCTNNGEWSHQELSLEVPEA